MSFVIFVNGLGLGGARATLANAAATRHFEAAHVAPYDAAYAAWLQEGEQEPIPEEQAEWAEIWRGAPAAVARALGVSESVVEVNLDTGES